MCVCVCGHLDVPCLLYCFIACTSSYIVLMSIRVVTGLSIIKSAILLFTLSLIHTYIP